MQFIIPLKILQLKVQPKAKLVCQMPSIIPSFNISGVMLGVMVQMVKTVRKPVTSKEIGSAMLSSTTFYTSPPLRDGKGSPHYFCL